MNYQRAPQDPHYPPPPGAYYPPPPPYAEGYWPQAHPLPQPQYQGYQGYFNQGYPAPPPPNYQHCPYEEYHHHHHHHQNEYGADGRFSFLQGCLAVLCCWCMLEECCFCL